MFGNFNDEAQFILNNAKLEMIKYKHPYIGSEHLVLSILSSNINISKRLNAYGLTYDIFRDEIINTIGLGRKSSDLFLYTPLLKKIIENSIVDAKENNNGEVSVEHLFSSLLEEGEGIAIRIFVSLNLNLDEMYDEFSYKLISKAKKNKKKKMLLDELGVDLCEKARKKELDPVIDRSEEINRVLEILCRRTKNNPILIGEAGVGKTAIVEEISRMIVEDSVPEILKNKRIISLDMASAVAGTKYRGEFEERMKKIIKEIEDNSDVILFIDEIHTLVGAGGAEGAIDASNILKPALARGKIRCIGATTIDEYKKYIEKDGALDRRFQKIIVDEPDFNKTLKIMLKLKPIYENFHNVKVDNEIINNIINLSNKYIYDRRQPDKSIDIMDEVCSMVSLRNNSVNEDVIDIKNKLDDVVKKKNTFIIEKKVDKAFNYRKKEELLLDKLNKIELNKKNSNLINVSIEDVAKVIHKKTKIPVYEIMQDNLSIITYVENKLRNVIIGQDEVINKLLNIAKRIKLGYKDNKCYSMMLVGKSGVGKSLISKIFAQSVVGINNFIRLDMSEYSDSTSVNKIIGSSPGYVGYEDNKNVLEEIRNKPFSVVLFDEIDKAHSKVINLLYQILDEGCIKNSSGIKVRFDNVIVIMTTNIGFEENVVGFNNNLSKVNSSLKSEFKKAFINRLDDIIVFNGLNEDDIVKIINNRIDKLKNKYNNIKLIVCKSAVKDIVNLCNYNEYGARQVDKIISSRIENIIIDKILNGEKVVRINKLKVENFN